VKCSSSDTASTVAVADDASSTDDTCDASSSCSDPSQKTPSSNLNSSAQDFVPLDVEEARREMQMAVEKELRTMRQAQQEHNILNGAAEDFLQRKLRAREAQKKFASRVAPRTES